MHFCQSSARLDGLITLYQNSPDFKGLAEVTRNDYSRYLTRISEHFGKVPLEVFNDTKMRGKIVAWRNQWADKPRTADMAAATLSLVLNHGLELGMLKVNVAAKIKNLHKANRSALIWEEEHWNTFYEANPPQHIIDVVEFASITGLRQEDALKVTWDMVSINAIIVPKTGKKKTRAVIPIIPELAQWLAKREHREGHLLRNSRGFPWTASGFKSSYQKKVPKTVNRHFHDLRGTYVTKLVLAGLTDQEIAYIVGWKAQQVEQIRSRYVNEEKVILDLAARIQAR